MGYTTTTHTSVNQCFGHCTRWDCHQWCGVCVRASSTTLQHGTVPNNPPFPSLPECFSLLQTHRSHSCQFTYLIHLCDIPLPYMEWPSCTNFSETAASLKHSHTARWYKYTLFKVFATVQQLYISAATE